MHDKATALALQSLKESVNKLARSLYEMHGLIIADNHKFYEDDEPLAKYCWNAAVVTYYNVIVDALPEANPDYRKDDFSKVGKGVVRR